MKYLVRLNSDIKKDKLDKLVNIGLKISYKSELTNLIIIDNVNNIDINILEDMDFIEEVQEDYFGELEKAPKLNIVPKVNFKEIHNNFKYGDTKVAVIDSGINETRNLNVIYAIDLTGSSTNCNDQIHGTLVANIINQAVPGVKLLNAKVTNTLKVAASDVIKAMEWAYKNGANIINMSMGFCRKDSNGKPIRCKGDCDICRIVKLLANKNVLVIAAAGNSGPRIGSVECPGNSPFAITVGAVNYNNNIEDFSSRGRIGQGKPDLVASGTIIIKDDYKETPYYGTSFSSPIISGICAGIFEKYKNINSIKNIILKSTENLNYGYHEQGKGKFSIIKLEECIEYEKSISRAFNE